MSCVVHRIRKSCEHCTQLTQWYKWCDVPFYCSPLSSTLITCLCHLLQDFESAVEDVKAKLAVQSEQCEVQCKENEALAEKLAAYSLQWEQQEVHRAAATSARKNQLRLQQEQCDAQNRVRHVLLSLYSLTTLYGIWYHYSTRTSLCDFVSQLGLSACTFAFHHATQSM
jgi:hypothetical protein